MVAFVPFHIHYRHDWHFNPFFQLSQYIKRILNKRTLQLQQRIYLLPSTWDMTAPSSLPARIPSHLSAAIIC